MSESYLEYTLPFLKKISKERKRQFIEYFRTAPMWLIDAITVEEMEKGDYLVREGEPVDAIYFIGEGTIKATDLRIYGISYDFMLFSKVYAYGGMEVIMDLEKYRTTLQTVTKCTVLKIPKAKYVKWIKTDIDALKLEAKLMGEYLLEQARNSRAYLFLQGADRLALLLTNRYEKYAVDGVLRLSGDRQELSDFTGLCLKTISRSIKKFTEDGLVTKDGKYIVIDEEQYTRLKGDISDILADDEL